MGRAKHKERGRKRSAASCQRLDKLLAKKSKRVNEEIIYLFIYLFIYLLLLYGKYAKGLQATGACSLKHKLYIHYNYFN